MQDVRYNLDIILTSVTYTDFAHKWYNVIPTAEMLIPVYSIRQPGKLAKHQKQKNRHLFKVIPKWSSVAHSPKRELSTYTHAE